MIVLKGSKLKKLDVHMQLSENVSRNSWAQLLEMSEVAVGCSQCWLTKVLQLHNCTNQDALKQSHRMKGEHHINFSIMGNNLMIDKISTFFSPQNALIMRGVDFIGKLARSPCDDMGQIPSPLFLVCSSGSSPQLDVSTTRSTNA